MSVSAVSWREQVVWPRTVVDIDSLMEGADEGLLMAVVRNVEHVLRPHFPLVIVRL